MRKRIIQAAFFVAGGSLAVTLMPIVWRIMNQHDQIWLNNAIVNFIIGAVIFWLLSLALWRPVDQGIRKIEAYLNQQSPVVLLIGSVSTLIGLALAVLVTVPLQRTGNFFLSAVIPVFVMLLFGYLGFRLGTTRIDEWRTLVPNFNNMTKRVRPRRSANQSDVLSDEETNYHHYKILDTNILIDGRIADLVQTGFIEGTLLVPNFVLYELQYIADAGESIKRVRGRRGLDILNELRETDAIPLEMWEGDYEDIKEVDEKLIRLAQDVNGILVTNDYNLNKVTKFQNVEVLNINELAGALRPRVAVGDRLTVTLVKNGTERQQAVGYLDDGTMVVAEEGRDHLQETVTVEVTSALQTDAGRMIFGIVVD
ncbi:PIN/TRAM domain-containing protein [Weissella confusa]|uniref:PIN domain nuclease n=1 Tax=Weissella confusa TaxID=1583 RepID=A0A4Z0RYH0_WEICO|nr:PIN/TRAM domain-containing protein [Weissella confusa]TGE75260.1 PIN domain nuclease [Weissella confusa]